FHVMDQRLSQPRPLLFIQRSIRVQPVEEFRHSTKHFAEVVFGTPTLLIGSCKLLVLLAHRELDLLVLLPKEKTTHREDGYGRQEAGATRPNNALMSPAPLSQFFEHSWPLRANWPRFHESPHVIS